MALVLSPTVSLQKILPSERFRHRVIPMPAPWMAAQNAHAGEKRALQRTMFHNSVNGIRRARGRIAARRRQHRRDGHLIKPNGQEEHPREHIPCHGQSRMQHSLQDAPARLRRRTLSHGRTSGEEMPLFAASPIFSAMRVRIFIMLLRTWKKDGILSVMQTKATASL